MVNFCAVALGLHHLGYEAVGVRIDSGDLAYLSKEVYNFAKLVANVFSVPNLENIKIVASNDINETTIRTLREQPNHINCFGIGTNLVTCQSQPALGCVYKLVQIDDQPTIKLSQDAPKRTLPGKKIVYRLYNSEGLAILDLMQTDNEPAPVVNQRILCRHPFLQEKRAYVTPAKVQLLLVKVWEHGSRTSHGASRSLKEIKHDLSTSLATIRQDIKRHLNPTPYKVSVTESLYNEFTSLYLESAPIGEL
jgi:nicotinate phosphoribosyltransferase